MKLPARFIAVYLSWPLIGIVWLIVTLTGISAYANSPNGTQSSLSPTIADWAKLARIGGFDADPEMSDQEVADLMTVRKNENVSVLEVDSGLSNYLNETQFQIQLNFLTKVANMAHDRNMRAVVYYPSLEVTTPNGENLAHTMYKDHPDWIQKGIDGSPNVFYGSQEVWVEPGMESAWMSPNTGYRDYFINRIKQLAVSGLDGVWIDVPIYLGTGASWAATEPAAAAAFKNWSIARGLGGSNGLPVPTSINWDDPAFRAWIQWRHENLAEFLEDVRKAAHQVNPNFMVVIENFPTDYMDATEAGLDGTYRASNTNFLRVWEIDSVSNTKAMKWASVDEFSNKITMYKWARAVDRENPSWAFSYGSRPLDAGLTMAASLAVGVVPFEAQTPEMTLSVDSAFRAKWFQFIKEHQNALLGTPRVADVGIWYSSPTRDFQDFKAGGAYGMYVTTTNPNNDPDWWSTEPGDSALPKPHLGGYRGAAHALIKLHVPFKIVADPGNPAGELNNLKILWLPSVAAISDEKAQLIKNFVTNGGIVFATGELPGTMDEMGNSRGGSIFQDLFNFGPQIQESVNFYGKGVAVYNPTVRGSDMFASVSDPNKANDDLSTVEQLVRIHVPDRLIVKGPEGIHVEVGQASQSKHYLYVLNYSGLQLPLVSSPKDVTFDYRAPEGYKVSAVSVTAPGGGQSISVPVQPSAKNFYRFTVNVDQFALVELTQAARSPDAVPPSATLNWLTPERREAAESGLNFILNAMRDSSAPEPASYGIFTNLIDDPGNVDIYPHGHHMTAEHMGLMLRASACMGRETAYRQSYRFVNELMVDPLYHIVNWAIDRTRHKPLVFFDNVWKNSNAPLDDFRVIRGLLEGKSVFDLPETEKLADTLLTGLYWTSVTDRDHKIQLDFPAYPNGLIGYAWDWAGTTDSSLNPPAKATGIGVLTTDPVPTDYNDLYMLGQAAFYHPRWKPVLASATDLLLKSEVPSVPGLFYNGYKAGANWTGDFENRDTNQGKHLKVIQTLWIALHLAQAADLPTSVLDENRRSAARDAAQRSLDFFKTYYLNNGKIPEYLTFNGTQVPNCTGANTPNGCLIADEENLVNGETRIYAQLARLALLLGDRGFAADLIEGKILTDRISDPNDPRYGLIGVSTASANDAEAWNVLESVLTLCLEARQAPPASNRAPNARDQSISLFQGQTTSITLTATDPDQDPLTFQVVSQPGSGTLSGNAPNLTYTPAANFTGEDSFTFKANDGRLDSNVATIHLTVAPAPPVNQAPVANSDSFGTNVNTALTFSAADLTSNDTDPDGDPLFVSQVSTTPATVGTLTDLSGGIYSYTPPQDFTGSDTLAYTLSDGRGGTSTGQIQITVSGGATTTSTYFPASITVTHGHHDWGTLASFRASDDDTYDIDSESVSGDTVVDWFASTTISESAGNIQKIKVIYRGQYSRRNVKQKIYLYNFTASQWELVDTSTVHNEDDLEVTTTINAAFSDYVSPQKELRVRIKGTRSSGSMQVWANYLGWEITSGGTTMPDPGPSNHSPTIEAVPDQTNQVGDSISLQISARDSDGDSLTFTANGLPTGLTMDSASGLISGTVSQTGQSPVNVTVNDGNGGAATISFNWSVTQSTPDPGSPITISFDFESDAQGWQRDPDGEDTATKGKWLRTNPAPTFYRGHLIQNGDAAQGRYALITRGKAGKRVDSYDVDGGMTSIVSPEIDLTGTTQASIRFSYYFAHLANANEEDYLHVVIVGGNDFTAVLDIHADGTLSEGNWQTHTADISNFAGQKIFVLIETADDGSPSVVEAGIDQVVITTQ
ncbi:MAG: hypothetical protein AXA67_05995 [Methylothermaceae bacteria B42]|nr:MAG: hypothetical protein AXA67_05995 [Methylothermaceae bacteria B42]HHJ40382.1 tandem-95 repeat protein [Methylothermaceae bacterium]